jgi:hypothetical protein
VCTDIYLYVEKKENDKWIALKWDSPYEENKKVLEGWLYSNRNYILFSILAGVRND